jgi:hypothetical protein
MTQDSDRLLREIMGSFTSEQSKEYVRRTRVIGVLLNRVNLYCKELASEIKERRTDEKQGKRLLTGLTVAAVLWWILRSLSIITSDAFFYFLLSIFLFLLARTHFAPEGPNAVAISTLKILTFSSITRIEELGIDESLIFSYVDQTVGVEESLMREIRNSYLSNDEAYGIFDEDDAEDDSESGSAVDTSNAWQRICLEIARAISED